MSISRRRFFSLSVQTTTLLGWSIFKSTKVLAQNYSKVVEKVQSIHRHIAGSPSNPIAIAWDPLIIEYPDIKSSFQDQKNNIVYSLVEEVLMLLSPEDLENPLSKIIKPGDTVVIKPNFCSLANFPHPVTHPSVLVPIIDHAIRAGAAKIIIAESPIDYQQGLLLFRSRYTKIKELVEFYQARYPLVEIKFVDTGFDEFTWVTLDRNSALYNYFTPEQLYHPDFRSVSEDIFYYADDSKGHNPQGYKLGCYAIANTFLDCDCFIGVPKLKTHNQTGITIALKNLMGINRSFMGNKIGESIKSQFPPTWHEAPHSRDVPHFGITTGKFEDYLNDPEKSRLLLNYENDTLWRSLADLNKIIQYADKQGHLQATKQRKVLTIVDGVIGGEGEGPIGVTPKVSSVIVAGFDPVNVDAACLRVMGWDVEAIPLVKRCAAVTDHPIGTYRPLEECLVGIEPDSPVFDNFYRPPSTYSDETIAPYTVRLKS